MNAFLANLNITKLDADALEQLFANAGYVPTTEFEIARSSPDNLRYLGRNVAGEHSYGVIGSDEEQFLICWFVLSISIDGRLAGDFMGMPAAYTDTLQGAQTILATLEA